MEKTITNLSDELTRLVGTREAFAKNVNKDVFKEYVSSQLVNCRNIKKSLQNLTAINNDKLVKGIDANKSLSSAKAYTSFIKGLSPRATTEEKQHVLRAVKLTTNVFCDILDELEENIDRLFKHNNISLFNTKLSHVVILGVLSEAKLVMKYSTYLISCISAAISGNDKLVAKYRYVFMEDNKKAMLDIVNRAITKTGSYNFLEMIRSLQTKSIDVNLLDDFNNPAINNVNGKLLSNAISITVDRGMRGLNIFRWIGEYFATKKHDSYLESKRTKEWMEAHVALLKISLDEDEKGSKEYTRLLKIVERYEAMINKSDKEIKDYESK